ncbi:hypothetical protein L3Y34_005168 [Caenorhabditis briggsae]|uniref:GPS domain-containing protein n=2 Tax=Caenorhabditis briggsae TaxID=6238 RepID=A0AAE9D7E7_CAEBR|nr:hypothetical protein L3Y34_005168 [Caenorhabditis briggsae]
MLHGFLVFLLFLLQIHSVWSSEDGVPIETIHAPMFEDVFDVRIHEGADKGSRLTMSQELQKSTEPLGHCFGQLETDVDWIEWKSSRSAFYTSAQMPLSATKNSNNLVGTLHLLCAGNQMHTFPFRVHITHRNHHPPTFSRNSYKFHVPTTLPIGSVIGTLEVKDQDPVIYNSERKLAFTKDESLVEILQDGTFKLKSDLSVLTPYTPQRMQILAIDYGSPQLFTIANITLIPVTVSMVRELHVNVATEEYQIFEWEHPQYGTVDKYRLSIRRDDQVVYEEELEAAKTLALTKITFSNHMNVSFQVTAIDENGETSSEWTQIGPIDRDVVCKGECSRGGTPLCYVGAFNRVEQFVDSRGAHCLCYPGFMGVSCETIDRCAPERTVDVWGGVDWTEVNTNISLLVPCPYNPVTENKFLERRCSWDSEAGRAIWERPQDRNSCQTQTSVLAHLGLIGTYSAKAATISAINTVTRFVRDLLSYPSFSRELSKHAHFDQKIAEMTALILDAVVQADLDRIPGNTTMLRADAWRIIEAFALTLPTPYSLSSPDNGIHMKSIEWVKHAEPNDNLIGKKCRLQLPSTDESHVIRVVCASNATLFELLEPKSPVMSIKPDSEDPFGPTRMAIYMRYPDTHDNYTCVYYDEEEKAWSTKGIRRIEHNYHGYVKCETNHFGVFALLPDRLFYNSESFWKDLASHMPTVTSFVTLICTVLLLFMAAVQKNQPIDCAFLFYLFFVFMIHLSHLLLFLAPQVGEPFQFSTLLHFVLQFCVIASSGLLCLVLYSIHTTIICYDIKEEEPQGCFSKPYHVFGMGILVPSLFTFTTYYFLDGRDLDIARLFERTDWLFISNYLLPTAVLFSISIVYAVWNVYIASGTRTNRRCSSDRLLALGPAISASVTSLFMVFFFCSALLLFFFREHSPMAIFFFCMFQFFHVVTAFFFASYLFRLRFLLQQGFDSNDSTDSLERKRDISRALLEHVDTKSDIASDRVVIDGGFQDAGFAPPSHYQYIPPGSMTHIDNNNRYMPMHQNIFERAPMVSIV